MALKVFLPVAIVLVILWIKFGERGKLSIQALTCGALLGEFAIRWPDLSWAEWIPIPLYLYILGLLYGLLSSLWHLWKAFHGQTPE
jgi:hypothetical protein